MNLIKVACLTLAVTSAQAQMQTVEEYNKELPVWGTSWAAGNGAINGYYPSFYTGFAPRSQNPDRVHVRLSRGNQTRATAVLSEDTIYNYLYSLKARKDFYEEMLNEEYITISPKNSALIPHVKYFNEIVEANVLKIISDFEKGVISKTYFYQESLNIMKKLNPGRVFDLDFDLANSFLDWRDESLQGAEIASTSSQSSMLLVNQMLWGRVNLTRNLKEAEIQKLKKLLQEKAILSNEGFVLEAVELFKSVTDDKYNFVSVDKKSLEEKAALVCVSLSNCKLRYSEFTAIYPTGSMQGGSIRDANGNSIRKYATVGLSRFTDEGSRASVDNIRKESYYGFAPKMDYETKGNGFHNPAVRLWPGSSTKRALGIPSRHTTFWPVKRGGVSHGCSRLPLGHIWEMRQIFPVENASLTKIYYFGNNSTDFDVFDVDGDGTLEVMGVKYYIEYNLQGSSGLAKREGEDLELNSETEKFFKRLYGSRGVLSQQEGEVYISNPIASIHTINDFFTRDASSQTRNTVKGQKIFLGDYRLAEQDYEQDKAQFYTSYAIRGFRSGLSGGGQRSLSKRFVRLFGRVMGCAPFANKETCGEQAFEKEKEQILKEIR